MPECELCPPRFENKEGSHVEVLVAGNRRIIDHAAFGGESAGGDGTPAFEVCQKIPSGSIAFVAVHPAGSVGGVTPSKVSANTVIRSEPGGHSGVAGLTAAKGPGWPALRANSARRANRHKGSYASCDKE